MPLHIDEEFFESRLSERDPEIFDAVCAEAKRQSEDIELIASENIVSRAVLEAQGSVLTNKYAEGYPSRRYYGGCEHVDIAESIAIDRLKKLFSASYANVQPHSGAQANGAVMLALLQPGDAILGMSLAAGGHLTHGAAPALSGKWFNAVHYGVRREDGLLDYEDVRAKARKFKPKMIIAGWSAYPRIISFKEFRDIADEVGAYLLVDMAHFAGLAAGGVHPSPVPDAHVITSTTHKTLRGPRGGVILTNDEALAKKINSAVFPGLQGGPLMHVIAAKAVAFGEALRPSFRDYARAIVENAQALSHALMRRGYSVLTGGTDTHVVLIDLSLQGLTGRDAETSLGRANLTCNKNAVPFDPHKPMVTSGIRLGAAAGTTRGFGVREFETVADLIADILDSLREHPEGDEKTEATVRKQAIALCRQFPIYPEINA